MKLAKAQNDGVAGRIESAGANGVSHEDALQAIDILSRFIQQNAIASDGTEAVDDCKLPYHVNESWTKLEWDGRFFEPLKGQQAQIVRWLIISYERPPGGWVSANELALKVGSTADRFCVPTVFRRDETGIMKHLLETDGKGEWRVKRISEESAENQQPIR